MDNKKWIFVVPLHSRSRWNKLTTMNSPCSLELPLFLLSPKISRFSGTPIREILYQRYSKGIQESTSDAPLPYGQSSLWLSDASR